MKYLTYNDIIREASACRNGSYIRVGYSKELKMLKGWQELGYRAYKLTETTIRLGVAYNKIASVIARKAAEADKPKVNRVNNWQWIIPNKVKYNSNTGKNYLQVATSKKGQNTRNQFLIYSPEEGWIVLEKEEWLMSEYFTMIDTRGKSSGDIPEVYTITFDNIYKLGSSGA